VTVTTHSRCDR